MAGTFKLERTKIEFDIYGEKFSVSRPTGGQLEDYFAAINAVAPEEANNYARQFLVSLGFTEKAARDLELPHIAQVFEQLTGVGKKSQTGS